MKSQRMWWPDQLLQLVICNVTFKRAICHSDRCTYSTWICRIFHRELCVCISRYATLKLSKIRAWLVYTNTYNLFIDFSHKPFKAHFFSSIQKRIWSMYLYTRGIHKRTCTTYVVFSTVRSARQSSKQVFHCCWFFSPKHPLNSLTAWLKRNFRGTLTPF